jgi:hypothetical protein
MTRTQRRAHVWAWIALAMVLGVGVAAGLMARPPSPEIAAAGGR